MDIETVTNLLKSVALDHSKTRPDIAIQKIAQALMHMAQSLHETEQRVAKLQSDVRDLERP